MRKNKIHTGSAVFDTCNVVLMCVFMLIMLVPVLHVLFVSVSDPQEVIKGGLFLYPKGFNVKGYEAVFQNPRIITSYGNTILYAVCGTLATLFFTALTAYPLSISNFTLKKPVTVYLTITMFFGGGMIPTYMLMRNLHLIDSRLVMIIPFCVGAYNVILFRTFFQGIPASLREAALIDGAGEYRILFQIILPLSKAILATIGLFTIVGKWNEWFSALIYLTDDNKMPVQMILRQMLFNSQALGTNADPVTKALMREQAVVPENIKYAAIIITMLPIMCIYPFLQKYFAKGVFVGTIKG